MQRTGEHRSSEHSNHRGQVESLAAAFAYLATKREGGENADETQSLDRHGGRHGERSTIAQDQAPREDHGGSHCGQGGRALPEVEQCESRQSARIKAKDHRTGSKGIVP